MSASRHPDLVESVAAMGASLLGGPWDLRGFRPAILAAPNGALFTASKRAIVSLGA
jgi:hypothetical protein